MTMKIAVATAKMMSRNQDFNSENRLEPDAGRLVRSGRFGTSGGEENGWSIKLFGCDTSSNHQCKVAEASAKLNCFVPRALKGASPHFAPGFYCGVGSGHVYCVALRRAPRRTVKYACGALGRAPCIHARLRRLATKPGEKCGLEGTPELATVRGFSRALCLRGEFIGRGFAAACYSWLCFFQLSKWQCLQPRVRPEN